MIQVVAFAGVAAALCLFRWVRSAALFGCAAFALWIFAAHAQKSALVQCTFGSHAMLMTDFECDTLLDEQARLTGRVTPENYANQVDACWRDLDRRFRVPPAYVGRYVDFCRRLASDLVIRR